LGKGEVLVANKLFIIMAAVTIRAIEPEDLDILYKIENDVQLWGVGITNVPYSRYMLHDYVAHSSGDIYADHQVRLMIDNEQGKTIGIVDIVDFEPQHRRAELGIVIQPQFRQEGYATLAVREVLHYAESVIHMHQLYVIVPKDNIASLRLFSQLGFEGGSILRDWLCDGHDYKDAVMMQYFF